MAPLFTASQPWRSISLWGTGREKSNNGRVPCPHLSLELFGNSSWNKLWGKEDQCKFYFEPKFWSLGKDGELKERIVKGGREGWVFFLINPFVSQYWDPLSTGSMEFSKRFMVAILNELMACWTFGKGELQTVNGSFSIPRFIFHSFNLISHYSLLQFRWFLTVDRWPLKVICTGPVITTKLRIWAQEIWFLKETIYCTLVLLI